MISKAFCGGAGNGKTTKLFAEVEAYLAARPLAANQRLLALTFMHGSRLRLIERLYNSSVRRRFDCVTVDRFAWELCRRWRTKLRASGVVLSAVPDYDGTCAAAGLLLNSREVVNWISIRYPVIIIDEFQDCASVRLQIIQRLHGRVAMFLAADDFQNLNSTAKSEAVMWLEDLGIIEELTMNHRTKVPELLDAARALRLGEKLSDSSALRLVSMPAAAPAASFISKTLAGCRPLDAVILSPARLESSKWVRNVIKLVGEKQYGPKKVGPFTIRWEKSTADIETEVGSEFAVITAQNESVDGHLLSKLSKSGVTKQLMSWVDHQRRVLGRTAFPASEVRLQIQRAVQHLRSFRSSHLGRRGMTIHQAKNREFPIVLLLWPFETPGDPVKARRWLYNAVTRAKKRVIILVQDPNKLRLTQPPFA